MFIGFVPSRELTYPTCKRKGIDSKSAKRRGYVSYPPVLFPLYFQNLHCFPRNSTTLSWSSLTKMTGWNLLGFHATSDAVLSVPEPKTWRNLRIWWIQWKRNIDERYSPEFTNMTRVRTSRMVSPRLHGCRNEGMKDPPPNGGGFFFVTLVFGGGGRGVTSRKRVHILTMKGIQYLQRALGRDILLT